MTLNRFFLSLGLLLMLCFSPLLKAKEKVQEVLFAGAEFPLILQVKDGQPQGLAVEVLERICERIGCVPIIEVLPWKRAQTVVFQGQLDVLIGPYINAERQKYLEFTHQYFYTDRMRFYALKSKPCCWQGDYEALKSEHIAANRGWYFSDTFERHRAQLNVREVNSSEIGFQMLLYNRVSLVASHERQAAYDLGRLQQENNIIAIGPEIGRHEGYFAFSKRSTLSTQFRQRFNQALSQMWFSGELERLSAAFGLTLMAPGTH